MLQLDEELQAVERITKRVEQAKDEPSLTPGTNGISITSAVPGVSPIEPIRPAKASLMVELIQQFADLSSNIEKLAAKSIKIQVDFPTNDFPKETTERLEIISRCDRYMHALTVKDHMLWTALQEKQGLEDKLQEERSLTHEYAQEITRWADMANSLSQEAQVLKFENNELAKKNRFYEDILRSKGLYAAAVASREDYDHNMML